MTAVKAPRPITDLFREIRYGEFLDEASDKFNALVTAVESTGKAGSMTITIKLKPSAAGAIELTDEVKAKLPELARGTSLFFGTPEGNLQRNNPKQRELPNLQVATPVLQPIKDAAHG
jgi:hypothetical protein